MKDLIKMILKDLPAYLLELGQVLLHPQNTVLSKQFDDENAFSESLKFFAMSVVISFLILSTSRHVTSNVWYSVISACATGFLAVTLFAVGMNMAWRLVGGKLSIKKYIMVYLYHSGVLLMVICIFLLFANGVLKIMEPLQYKQIIDQEMKIGVLNLLTFRISGVSENSIYTYIGIQMIGCVFAAVWLVLAWGTYRILNDLSKVHSFVACVFTMIIAIPMRLFIEVIMVSFK